MTKWTTPDEDGNIHIPEELVDLVNSVAIQIGYMIRSGKNEVQTICDIVSIAEEYFAEQAKDGDKDHVTREQLE